MIKSIEQVATSLVKWLMPLCLLTVVPLISCEEDDDDDEDTSAEYENWQQRNDEMLELWAADPELQKYKNYALNESATAGNSDCIYVKVLESGTGESVTPFLTDTVRIAYRGRLIPSKTYPEGFVFDQSYLHDFRWATAYAAQGTSWIPGIQTALLKMHVGDRWLIHVPYQLGYGSSTSNASIPAFSNLVFDGALYDVWHPGETRPPFKVR